MVLLVRYCFACSLFTIIAVRCFPICVRPSALFSGQLPRDYASLFFLNNPDNGLHTVIHAQGAFTTFEEQGRAYDMRAVYEITDAEFRKMGSLHQPLIAALDKLHRYDTTEYGSGNLIDITPVPPVQPLSETQQLLRQCLVFCVVNNRQLFLRLGSDLKKSWKRHSARCSSPSFSQASRPACGYRFAARGLSRICLHGFLRR